MLLAALLPRAGALPASPRHPDKALQPPPRRRGGEPAAPPQDVNSHAPQHLENPCTLFRTLSLRFPDPKPQNTTASAMAAVFL